MFVSVYVLIFGGLLILGLIGSLVSVFRSMSRNALRIKELTGQAFDLSDALNSTWQAVLKDLKLFPYRGELLSVAASQLKNGRIASTSDLFLLLEVFQSNYDCFDELISELEEVPLRQLDQTLGQWIDNAPGDYLSSDLPEEVQAVLKVYSRLIDLRDKWRIFNQLPDGFRNSPQ